MVASVEELEELGRKVMGCSVMAEYLELPNVVSYLDTVFAEIVGRVVAARRRSVVAVAEVEEEFVEGL